MVERIIVSFAGESSGEGILTWGQQQLWRAMVEMDSSLGIGGVVPLGPGHKPEDTAAELSFFMTRYQALRTRLRFLPDGTVRQVVASSGETWVDVIDTASADDDPLRTAGELFAQWRARKYDYENEWPMRLAVVRHQGACTHVVAMLCHIAADGVGVGVMLRELRTENPPPVAMQPLELVQWQQTPAAQRLTDSAMRYWESNLRSIPADRFGPAVDRGEPRFMQICWASRAMLLAIHAISERDSADSSHILLAATAAGLARVTGANPYVAQTIVNNRFRPGLSDMVSPLNQNGLAVVDVEGVTFPEVVDRARRASLASAKYAYYDPATRERLIARISSDRGEKIDLASFINDRRSMTLSSTPQAPAAADEIVAAQKDTAVLWEAPLRLFNEKLMVNFDEVGGTIQVTAEVDTRYLSLEDLKSLMTAMEAVTVEAALDPSKTV